MTKTLWRWEQDGSGGLSGTATYFPNQINEITVPMPDFATAHKLWEAMALEFRNTHRDARAKLLAQIGAIQP